MDSRATRTAPVEEDLLQTSRASTPGLVAVFSGRPLAVPFGAGAPVGRLVLADLGIDDDQMSRDHFALDASGRVLLDAGSRNGTFVDGVRAEGKTELSPGTIVRAGRTLFVATDGCAAFERSPTRIVKDEVHGPSTAESLSRAKALGQLGQLLVTGESGVGKELVARAFHSSLEAKPFVALNCATIPNGIAERLLFGAKRGAYTGAEQDAEGFVRAANGGTLFLDEVAELDLGVQSKLLRFLETREYFPVGETRPVVAQVRVCFATLRELSAEVAARRFREDLYHRIASPTLRVSSLAARREEIPFLIDVQARRFAPRVSYGLGFVERALLADWPGNIRQLLRTVEAAFATAEIDGRSSVAPSDLPEPAQPEETSAAHAALTAEPSDDEVRHAMAVSGGNVSVAARALGVHRSKLRRHLAKLA